MTTFAGRTLTLLALGITASIVTLHLARYLTGRRRRANGLCPACGYDLRATPDRCPECGAPQVPVRSQ